MRHLFLSRFRNNAGAAVPRSLGFQARAAQGKIMKERMEGVRSQHSLLHDLLLLQVGLEDQPTLGFQPEQRKGRS
jgi:hypothetical protein